MSWWWTEAGWPADYRRAAEEYNRAEAKEWLFRIGDGLELKNH